MTMLGLTVMSAGRVAFFAEMLKKLNYISE
jgi:hypothetical protein